MIDIKKVLTNEALYTETYEKYYNKVLKSFADRKKVISVDFPDGNTYKMKINKFLVNMILWRPFMVFKKDITPEYIIEVSNINTDVIANYFDIIIYKFVEEDDVDPDEMNLCLAEMITQLGYFSLDFNKIIGNTISIYDMIQLSKTCPEFDELLHTRYDENKIVTRKIEEDLSAKTKVLLGLLSKNKNCLQDYVNSKEGLNKNQLTQFLINIGPKPDLQENVYPKIVNTNFVSDGLSTVSDYFINSNGGRKAAITNHSKTKASGYLMRKLSILCINALLSDTVDDCGSTNYIKINMNSTDTMKRYDKRFYYSKKKNELKLFTYNDEAKEKFKNKTLLFRSPATCCSPDGKICKKCYGTLSKYNYNIHVGILGILILTSQITQKMLSSKHLLKTDSKEIQWDENFQELFTLNGNILQLNDSVDGLNRYTLIISEDEIQDNEEGLDDNDYSDDEDMSKEGNLTNITKYFRKFVIRKKIEKLPGHKYDGDYEYYNIDNYIDLYISPYFERVLKKSVINDDGDYEVSLKDIELNNPIFYIDIANIGLSAILNDIIALIDKKERLGTNTYNEMIVKFVDLCNDSGIIINSVHLEIIIRELIKDSSNILQRPDFSKKDPSYILLRLSESILNSNSIITSISFERFKEQIYNARTYKKTAGSPLDDFFR